MVKIGIIVHSQTGHTYSVAGKLQDKISGAGHEVSVERVIPVGEIPPGANDIKFESQPDVTGYEGLLFGAPVQAFSLSPAMNAYMAQIGSLQDKKIALFVTKGAPFHWTGGNQAISKMKKMVESRGGTVVGTGIVVWRGNREKEVVKLVEKLGGLF